MYSKKVVEFFKNTEYAGEMKDADVVEEVGNVKCGDVMRIYLKIKDDKIIEIKYLTYGCMAAIASTEALCQVVKGMTLDEASKVTHQDIVKALEGLPQIKVHCSSLSIQALRKAIESYKEN